MASYHKKGRQGFTLLEVVVAIGILVIALGGSMSLVILTRESESSASSNLTASFLAREGQELVRGVRDANYANDTDFFTGIADTDDPFTYSFIMDINGTPSIVATESDNVREAPVLRLYQDNYQYSEEAEAVDTPFHRLITTTYHPADSGQSAYLDVKVQVYWNGDTKDRTYTLTSQLYDWK